ncbi:hypothetical protein [Lagierella sp.]|uniref:hypothetical protein n=1 Tax=Lagierella sp. TaxID=2849657 RepID=UPI00262C86F9|nr:hypothetical protein [Lagierella sp.]
MKYLLLTIFLIATAYNFYHARNIKYHTKTPAIVKITLLIFTLFSVMICFKYDNTIVGYILVAAGMVFVFSFTRITGISDGGFFVDLSSMIAKFVPFEAVKDLRVINKDDLELRIVAYGTTFKQVYSRVDSEKVISILNSNNFSDMPEVKHENLGR